MYSITGIPLFFITLAANVSGDQSYTTADCHACVAPHCGSDINAYPLGLDFVAQCDDKPWTSLNLSSCIGLNAAGKLIAQDNGGFWLHGGVKDIRCQYGMTSDGTGFTASCDGYDESVLPVDQVLNVNDEGLLTCFEHVGTPMGKDWKPQYRLQTGPGPVIYTPASKAVSPRDISPNATMSGALGPTGTALNSGCPQRAFKPPGWDERVCNATEPGINAGESSMAIRIGSLMVLLALGVFLI